MARYTRSRTLGFLGEPRVKMLPLNLALDKLPATWSLGVLAAPSTPPAS